MAMLVSGRVNSLLNFKCVLKSIPGFGAVNLETNLPRFQLQDFNMVAHRSVPLDLYGTDSLESLQNWSLPTGHGTIP